MAFALSLMQLFEIGIDTLFSVKGVGAMEVKHVNCILKLTLPKKEPSGVAV